MMTTAMYYLLMDKKENMAPHYHTELLKQWTNNKWMLVAVVMLFPLNWACEALKWKFLIEKIEKISFTKAYAGVLSGVSFGFFTPHNIGDYIGRISQLASPERIRGIGAVFLSRIAQFYITLYFGTIALVYALYNLLNMKTTHDYIFIFFIVLTNVVFILVFVYYKEILNTLDKIQLFNRFSRYYSILKHYSLSKINFVLLLSFTRYCIFSTQYYLLLNYFGIKDHPIILAGGIAFIFLAKSVLPTMFDLGVRELSAITYFSIFSYPKESVLYASLTLWLVNIVVPALIGMFLIFKIRIFKSLT